MFIYPNLKKCGLYSSQQHPFLKWVQNPLRKTALALFSTKNCASLRQCSRKKIAIESSLNVKMVIFFHFFSLRMPAKTFFFFLPITQCCCISFTKGRQNTYLKIISRFFGSRRDLVLPRPGFLVLDLEFTEQTDHLSATAKV